MPGCAGPTARPTARPPARRGAGQVDWEQLGDFRHGAAADTAADCYAKCATAVRPATGAGILKHP
jgi:hypothetical protein